MGVILDFPIGRTRQHDAFNFTREPGQQSTVDDAAEIATLALHRLAQEIAGDPQAVAGEIETVIDEKQLCVWKQGIFRGVWRLVDTRYEWVPAAYLMPALVVRNAFEAARATVGLSVAPSGLESYATHCRLATLGDGNALASAAPASR